MDYFDVLKKAWNITWRYKALWVLGLFAGAASGGGGGGTGFNSSTGGGDFTGTGAELDQVYSQVARGVQDNIVLIAIAVGLMVIIGLAFWVLSIAAQGGLVYGANEAAEGRRPALGAAWGVGFRRWGRVFMIGFVLALPILAVIAVLVAIFTAAGIGGALTGDQGLAVAIGGACLLLPLLLVLIAVGSVILGIVFQLALRYGVVGDVTFGQAIKRGWADLWGKRGAFIFWLVMLLPGFAYGVVTLIIMLPFIVGGFALIIAEQYLIGLLLLFAMILVMLVPGAIYGTFISSAWTVFFRRMTGMEEGPAPAVVAPPQYAAVPEPPASQPYPGGYEAPPAPGGTLPPPPSAGD